MPPDHLLILMYHAIDVADGQPASEDYTLSSDLFTKHLQVLKDEGARPYPLASLLEGSIRALPPGDGPIVLLTFDDGFESVLTRAVPLMHEADWNSSLLFITSDHLGKPGYLRPQQVSILLGMGVAVGAHGASHRYLTDLPLHTLREELTGSRQSLEAQVGYKVQTMSAPGGRIDRRVVGEAYRAGYRGLFGSEPGLAPLQSPRPDVLPRFSITQSTSPQMLRQLVRGKRRAILKAQARYKALALPKQVLGNQGYDSLRKLWLDARRGKS